jgi:NTP pyrophosphatase (non-canonical NTP hydrolase)
MIERFDIDNLGNYVAEPDGPYVKYDDHLAEIGQLKAGMADEQKSIGELAWEIAERTDTSKDGQRHEKWREEVSEVEESFDAAHRYYRPGNYWKKRTIDELADVLITTLSFAQALGEPNLMERAREKALKVLAGLE